MVATWPTRTQTPHLSLAAGVARPHEDNHTMHNNNEPESASDFGTSCATLVSGICAASGRRLAHRGVAATKELLTSRCPCCRSGAIAQAWPLEDLGA